MSLRNPAIFPENDNAEVNLTPMLDVVFILLIFFVVTATFTREFGVATEQPGPGDVVPATEAIVVRVEPNGIFRVNGRVVSRESLLPYVRALLGGQADITYSVLMARGSRVGDIVKSIDVGRQLGFEVVPVANVEDRRTF